VSVSLCVRVNVSGLKVKWLQPSTSKLVKYILQCLACSSHALILVKGSVRVKARVMMAEKHGSTCPHDCTFFQL